LKNILTLLIVCNLFLPHIRFKSYSTRRIRDSVPAQTIYFYQDELGIVGKWLSGAGISEDEHTLLLRVASALGVFEEEVDKSLTDTAGTKKLVQNIAKKTLISLVEAVQSGNTRYLEAVNKIPAIVLSLLGGLHQGEVLSESELNRAQNNLGGMLFGVLTSDDVVVTEGERMIALKGLEKYGRYEDIKSLLAIRDTLPLGIKKTDLDTVINALAGQFAPRFKNFDELKEIVRDSPTPVFLRMKDNSFLSIKNLRTVYVLWHEIAFIEYSDGSRWEGSWKQFLKEEVFLPVVWNDFL